ncbi:MAG TPA: outer membrane protein assembly factor BamC [Usitatibacter sp.]|nr:outer membrane protein assembly factor BamC [Usitatibacter sp.]
MPAALALATAGCSWFGGNKPDYKDAAQARAEQPLEVPPELSAPTMDDRYSIPDPHAQTSYSDYTKRNAGQGEARATGPAVLPAVKGVQLERDRDQRWLVVKGEPDKVWPLIRRFWIDNGFALSRESPDIGIMETEWHEDRAKIPQDFIRRTIGRVIDGVYSTPRRDKFRTRLEKGAVPGTTEVFVSHRGMEEVYTDTNQTSTKWQPLPPDPELEAEMLSRLMVKLGGEETKVAAQAKAPAGAGRLAAASAPAAEARNAVLENSGAGPLVLNDGFDRAWRRVGLALDRTGFTVEDRDRSKGLFFVRYIDPEAEAGGKDESFLAKLAFWKPAPKGPKPQYRIHVSDAGPSTSEVTVQDASGAIDKGSTGKKILAVLFEQLK